MKPLKFILLLLLCVGTFSSCKKGYDTGVSDVPDYTLSMKVDGTAKVATLSYGAIYSSGNTFQLGGQFADGSVINIMINSVGVGTFDIVKNGSILSYGTDSTYANTYLATSGTVNITSITNDTISGTFQFNATGTGNNKLKVITEGVFRSKYTKI